MICLSAYVKDFTALKGKIIFMILNVKFPILFEYEKTK